MIIMDKQTQEVHQLLLVLAKKIDAICEKRSINYSLEGGSLLGAVRHKGFIPWDNDFDFFMTRENYNRFLEVAEKDLGQEYRVYTYQAYDNYPFAFAKICILKNPISYFDQTFSFETFLHIDVFPIDYVAPGRIAQFIQKHKAVYYKRMLIMHDGGLPAKSASKAEKLLFFIAKPLSKLYSHKRLVNQSEKNLQRYDQTDEMALMMGVYGFDRTKMPEASFNTYIRQEFEDTSFMCVRDYDRYLKQLYGDYMTLPPENKRVGHDFMLVK